MAKVQGYMNVYRSGFFHTPGKPGAYDRHPGDLYATREAAEADIYPRSHFIATVGPVEWDEPEVPAVNPMPRDEIAAQWGDGDVTRIDRAALILLADGTPLESLQPV